MIAAPMFWTTTVVVFASAVPLGANRPVAWLALSTVLLAVFALRAAADLGSKAAARDFLPLAPAALLYVGAAAWGAAQAWPDIEAWSGGALRASPAWDAVVGGVGSISPDPHHSWHIVLRLLAYAGAFWIAARACADPRRAAAFIDAVAVWGAMLAAYGVAAHFAGFNPVVGSAEGYPDSATGTFVNRNAYAFYVGLGFLANLAAVLRRVLPDAGESAEADPSRARRRMLSGLLDMGWFFIVGAMIAGAAVALSESRGGAAATVVGAVTLVAAYLARNGGAFRLLAPVLAALAAGVALVGVSGMFERFSRVGVESADRLEIYRRALDGVADAPWAGHGLGAFQEAFRAYAGESLAGVDVDLAHNAYLENAFELGVPAAAALYLALGLVVWRLWRGVRTRRRNLTAPCFAAAAATAGALHSLIDFSLQMPASAALFAMILGAGWAQSFSSLRRRGDGQPMRRSAHRSPPEPTPTAASYPAA